MSAAPTQGELRELQASATRQERRLKPMKVGEVFLFMPGKKSSPHYGQRVTVVRAPRPDVKSPSVRIEFADGHQFTAPVSYLRTVPTGPVFRPRIAPPDAPLTVQDARSRPAWKRLLREIDELAEADRTGLPREALDASVRHRAAQLAGMVSLSGTPTDEKAALAAQLRVYAELDAQRGRTLRPGRDGHPLQPSEALSRPTQEPDSPQWLDQQQRRMVNAVARSIHLRYFISDRAERHTVRVPAHIRAALRDAGRAEDRAIEQPSPSQPRASELHLVAGERYREMVAASLEVCQLLASGKDREAHALLGQQQAARVHYSLTQRQIEALRPMAHTGRFFHGDILSVRDERPEDGSDASPDASGMTQSYTRLTIVYAEDGHTLTVANAPELEARTATAAGNDAWRDLCRWVTDTSERRDGKKQGRRQEDAATLIYRENEGNLRLRESISETYPRLVAALDVIRRSLEPESNDVLDSEISQSHPARGFHPAAQSLPPNEGGT